MLHRETRNIHLHHIVSPTLREAKERVRACSAFTCDKPAVLALTPQGEGDHIWCAAEDKDEVLRRVANYKSCYGYWTVRAWRKEG